MLIEIKQNLKIAVRNWENFEYRKWMKNLAPLSVRIEPDLWRSFDALSHKRVAFSVNSMLNDSSPNSNKATFFGIRKWIFIQSKTKKKWFFFQI